MQKYKNLLYREIEDKLYKYFNRNNIYNGLNKQLNVINKQIADIEKELRECNYISIDEESSSPGFDERVQTSSTGTSYVESQMIKLTELKLKRKAKKERERENILEQLEDMETIESEIEWKIRDFKGELKTLLELKYEKRMGEQKIALEMHLSQSQVNRKKQQIINKIILWGNWGSIKNA